MKRLLVAVISAAGLAACSTPTAFVPTAPGASASGFWDSKLEPDRFRVSYRGGTGASTALVQDYALLHAADLTVAEGYDWFRVVGRFGEASAPRHDSSVSIGGGTSSYGHHSASGVGLGFQVPLGGGPQLTETIEIVLGRGVRPNDPDVYSARDLQKSIRGRTLGA